MMATMLQLCHLEPLNAPIKMIHSQNAVQWIRSSSVLDNRDRNSISASKNRKSKNRVSHVNTQNVTNTHAITACAHCWDSVESMLSKFWLARTAREQNFCRWNLHVMRQIQAHTHMYRRNLLHHSINSIFVKNNRNRDRGLKQSIID